MGFFSKNSRWNMIFLVLSWKMILLFPENMILSLGRKKKDNLSQKKYTEIWWNFLQTFWKRWSFQKRPRWDMIFLVLSGKMGFFSWRYGTFPWAESQRWSFSKSTCKYGIFCVHVRMLQTWRHAPLSKKIKYGIISQNTPKGDWRSRLTF